MNKAGRREAPGLSLFEYAMALMAALLALMGALSLRARRRR